MGFFGKLFGGGAKAPSGQLDVVVERKRPVGEGLIELVVKSTDGKPLPAFEPGAHVDFFLEGGLVRQYSLCSDAAKTDTWAFGVLVEPNGRGGSRALGAVAQGQTLRLGLPRNHFPLVAQGPVVLIGGGIGITPLMSMAHRLAAEGRPFSLNLCARTSARAAFADELKAAFKASFQLHLDPPGQAPAFAALLQGASPEAHVYTCGPDGFMAGVQAAAQAAGFAAEHVHTESFTPAAPRTGDEAFEVILKKSGKTIQVGATETIAEAMERVGVPSNKACGSGACGSCMQVLAEGTPDHRDQILTKKERAQNKSILVCVSRAKSPRLIIDA